MSLQITIPKRQLLYCTKGIPRSFQNHSYKYIMLPFFLIFLCCTLNAQQLNEQQATSAWLDQLVGSSNLPIHTGKVYEEAHRIKSKKSKFFNSPEFTQGTVKYKAQYYYKLPLKYNVYDDQLLLQIDNELGGNILQLYKPDVKAFTIGTHQFVHISDAMHKGELAGYYELAFAFPRCSLLLKHRKLLKRQLEGTQVYYEFEDLSSALLLWYQNNYHEIKAADDLLAYFPNHEADLLAYKAQLDKKLGTTTVVTKMLQYLKERQAFEPPKTQHK